MMHRRLHVLIIHENGRYEGPGLTIEGDQDAGSALRRLGLPPTLLHKHCGIPATCLRTPMKPQQA